jgi:hypothetical protein
MIRDTLIIVVVLLILLTIVSAFGGSLRHTPAMSPEGFFGYTEMFEEDTAGAGADAVGNPDKADAREAGLGAADAREAGLGAADAREAGLGAADDVEEEDAEAVATAAMAEAGLGLEHPEKDTHPVTKSIESFQSEGTYATW